MDFLLEDWSIFLLKMIGAFLLALPVAWDREKSTRIMGLRTFPLVAVASCAYVLIALIVLSNNEKAQARIVQGLITGIGFIGGGAIFKEGNGGVRGTASYRFHAYLSLLAPKTNRLLLYFQVLDLRAQKPASREQSRMI